MGKCHVISLRSLGGGPAQSVSLSRKRTEIAHLEPWDAGAQGMKNLPKNMFTTWKRTFD